MINEELIELRRHLLGVRGDLIELRFELKRRQLVRALLAFKANFDPDQPRDDIGRWTSAGGRDESRIVSDALPDPIIPWAEYAGEGHHYVPRNVFGNPKYSLSSEALDVFESERTGSLKVPTSNYFDRLHRDYNDGVEESLDQFLKTNKIDPAQMTAEQAKAFSSQAKASDDPRIRRFNMRLWMRESMYWLRRGIRGRE